MNKSLINIFEKTLPLERISPKVRSLLDCCQTPLCVACSGGPDSLALLMMLRYYWPNKTYVLLHYNHGVRNASVEEELKIKAFAEHLNLKIEVGHRLNNTLQTEECLRKDRYAFFEKMLRLYHSNILILGHHQDDLFETVLMRLVRGVSLEGLIAPRAIHSVKFYTKVRPLLGFKKDDLINLCKQLNLEYFWDHTNELDICVRNRVRRQVLSKFDEVFIHNWRKGFARTCSILEEHRVYLKKKLSEKFQSIDFSKKVFPKALFNTWESLEVRYFLQTWLQAQNIYLANMEILDKLTEYALCNASISINLNQDFICKFDGLNIEIAKHKVITKENFYTNWRKGILFFPNHKVLRLEKHLFQEKLLTEIKSKKFDHKQVVVVDYEVLKFPLIVRNWHPGDRYCPIGKTNEKKLKDLFVDNKIQDKNKVPVICNSTGEIVWVPGLPPALNAKISPTTKICIFLFYQNLEMV